MESSVGFQAKALHASTIEENTLSLVLAAVGIFCAAWAFHGLSVSSLWVDELYSLFFSTPKIPLDELLINRIPEDVHPPLYYALLHGWQLVTGSDAASVRLLSACLGVAVLAVAYFGSRHLLSRPARLALVALISSSSVYTYFSQEARPYMLLLLLVVSQTLIFYTIFQRRHCAARDLLNIIIIFTITSLISSFTHYYGFIISGALFMCLLFMKRENYWYVLVLSLGFLVFSLTFSYIIWSYVQIPFDKSDTWIKNDLWWYYGNIYKLFKMNFNLVIPLLILILYSFLSHVKYKNSPGFEKALRFAIYPVTPILAFSAITFLMFLWHPSLAGPRFAALIALILSLFIFTLFSRPADGSASVVRLWLARSYILFVPCAILIAVTLITSIWVPTVTTRNLTVILPPIWLATALLIDVAAEAGNQRLRRAILLFLAMWSVLAATGAALSHVPQKEEWRNSAAYVDRIQTCWSSIVPVLGNDWTSTGGTYTDANATMYRHYLRHDVNFWHIPKAKTDGPSGRLLPLALIPSRREEGGCPVLLWAVHRLNKDRIGLVRDRLAQDVGVDPARIQIVSFPHFGLQRLGFRHVPVSNAFVFLLDGSSSAPVPSQTP